MDFIQTWLAVICGTYGSDMFLAYCQYAVLKARQKESLPIIFFRFILSLFLVAWLIYGNYYYFHFNIDDELQDYYGACYGLSVLMLLVLIVGYFEMLKCCCISTFICIMFPIILGARRNAQRPNWMPAPTNFIQSLARTTFNP